MTTSVRPPLLHPPVVRPPLLRRPDRSPVGIGVAAGLADHLGLPVLWVRVGFVATALAGFGVPLYGAAWLLLPTVGRPAPIARFRARDALDVAAYALVALGLADLVRLVSQDIPWWFLVPVVGLFAGVAVTVVVAARTGRPGIPTQGSEVVAVLTSRPGTIARTLTGLALVAGGAAALLASNRSWVAMRNGVLALVVLFTGVGLAIGPWLWRLGTELVAERRARVRESERAEMAAHLHDSVLQTLAMVQRRASDPTEVVRLARRQERELRDWLFAGQPGAAVMTHGTVGAALADLAHELEELHGVPVDVVQVRDVAVGPLTAPLLQAAREAIVNAQRHSGAAVVSVFCEIEPDAVVIYVRDRGCGFDGDSVERDRRGIADSIVGRLARHGGVATVRSTPGEGTEVMMRAPLEAS